MSDLDGKRILIVKPSSLGDVVHTLPLVHALKRCARSCRIGWIVQKPFAGVLENDPDIDEIIPIFIPSTSDPNAPPGAWRRAFASTVAVLRDLRRRFRDEPYDYVLDLHASFRSGLLGLTNPGGTRIGFADAKELNPLFQRRRLTTNPDKPHAVDKNLVFADFFGCPPVREDFRIAVGREARGRAERFLEDSGVTAGSRFVYANPAARWATKYWTAEAWAELADLLITRSDAAVVFGGAAGDAAYIDTIAARMRESAIIAAGKLTLGESTALLKLSDAYVGVDSGPMHIAAFTNTPVIALFGPTDPAKVGPYGEGHMVVRRMDLECLACRKRSCDDPKCLAGISGRDLYERMTAHLGWAGSEK